MTADYWLTATHNA